MNISSAIINARPGSAEPLRSKLSAISGVQVHAVSAEGRLIVTIEAEDDRATADTYESIEKLDDVMSMAMVYHQVESDPEMDISVQADPRVAPQLLGDPK